MNVKDSPTLNNFNELRLKRKFSVKKSEVNSEIICADPNNLKPVQIININRNPNLNDTSYSIKKGMNDYANSIISNSDKKMGNGLNNSHLTNKKFLKDAGFVKGPDQDFSMTTKSVFGSNP